MADTTINPVTETVTDITPSASDITPSASDITPSTSDITPSESDITSFSSHVTPSVGDVTSSASDITSSASDVTPSSSDITPSMSDITTKESLIQEQGTTQGEIQIAPVQAVQCQVDTTASMSLLEETPAPAQAAAPVPAPVPEKTFSDIFVQTEVEPKTPTAEGSMQTETAAVVDGLMQTDMLPTQESEVQATVTMFSSDMQTIIKEYGDDISQTDLSMALQSDSQSQTFIATEHANVQAVVEQEEAVAQTEHNEVHACMQTDSPVLEEVLSQTDQSMALQMEQESQAVVDTMDTLCQAVMDSGHQESQTSTSMALESHVETQMDGPNKETIHSQTEQTPTEHGGVQTEQVETGEQDCQTDDIPQVVEPITENGFDGTPDGAVPEAMEEIAPKACSFEAEAQTDPVTIIIGDASFLVKKLKSSASHPSKISSQGNEIEIEVNSDSGRFATPSRRGRQSTGGDGSYGSQSGSRPRQGGARVRMPVQRSPGMRGGTTRGGSSVGGPVMPSPKPVGSGDDGARTVSGRRYNCPFCTRMFEESPTLYEHIQNDHDEQRALLKKPKGREGKTILMKEKEPEIEPPVLTPMVNIAGESDMKQEQVVSVGQLNTITSLPVSSHQVQVLEIAPTHKQIMTQTQQPQQQQVYVTTADDHLAQQEQEVAAIMAARQGEVGQYAEVHQVEVDGRQEQVLVQYVQHLSGELAQQEGAQIEVAEEAIIQQHYEVQEEQTALVQGESGGEIMVEVNPVVDINQHSIVTQQVAASIPTVTEPMAPVLQSMPATLQQVRVVPEQISTAATQELIPAAVPEADPATPNIEDDENAIKDEEVETTAEEDGLDEEDEEDDEEISSEEPVSPLKRKRQQLEGPIKRQKMWELEYESGDDESPVQGASAKRGRKTAASRATRSSGRSPRGRGK